MADRPELPPISIDELAVIYSAAILADDDVAITADKLTAILKAAGVDVEPIWPTLYARALQNVDVRHLLTDITSGAGHRGGVAGQSAAAGLDSAAANGPSASAAASAAADTTTAKDSEDDDGDDDDLGLNLFD